jgi:hypothetical protein
MENSKQSRFAFGKAHRQRKEQHSQRSDVEGLPALTLSAYLNTRGHSCLSDHNDALLFLKPALRSCSAKHERLLSLTY